MNWVGKAFVGLGVVVAFLLLYGAVFAFTAYNEAKPYIEREYPAELYARTDDCQSPCGSSDARDTWTVPEGANELKFTLRASLETPSGPAHIVITDPSGDVLYDRVITQGADEELSWAPEAGEWTLTRTYGGVLGTLEFRVWSEGIPPGSLS